MKIIEHTGPKLPNVKMVCDEVIDKKLTEHEAVECCFGKSQTTLIAGGTGSGKTSFVIQMLRSVFKKCFHEIIVIMPRVSFESIEKRDNPFLKLNPENVYHEFNPDVLSEVYAKIEENSAEKCFTLLIIDDYGASLKEKANQYILEQMWLKQRHLRLSVMLLIQNYYQAPKKLREISTNLVMMNTNRSQNFKMFKELFDLKESQFHQLLRLLPTSHDYLILNLRSKRIFHDWNEVVFDE